MEKIKIVIADDNVSFCDILSNFLKKYEDIEILTVVNNDEDEIYAIDTLKPDIVITDLKKSEKYSGIDIIKKYGNNSEGPDFFVITASDYSEITKNNLRIVAFMQKPFSNYEKVIEELRRIKREKMQVLQVEQNIVYNTKKNSIFQKIKQLLKIEKR